MKSLSVNHPNTPSLFYRKHIEHLLYLLPAFIFVGVFLLYPVLYTIYVSFTRWDGLNPPEFIGFANYLQIAQEPVISTSISNTFIWVAASLFFPVGLGLLFAVFVNRIPFQGFFKAMFYFPYAISATSTAVIWTFMLTPTGVVNEMLEILNLGSLAKQWLLMPPWNTISMLAAFTWQTTGTNMILFLVGLQGLPIEPIEAAKLDGASGWQSFIYVTFPMLKPITMVVVTMAVVNSFKVFDLIWIMTQGGPFRSSETLAVTMYRESFVSFRLGFGASIANFLSIIVIIFSIVYLKSIFQKED
ncbi:MAG: sugar ABC transporter permease [Chloroflexi bacterium]|nr:sugar ABC transporter permease [Chloroflexota bacterium]